MAAIINPMTEDIEFLISRFPTQKEKILEAYKRNGDFKSLCEDFYSSAILLQNQKKKIIKDKRQELEYQKLFLDLETELMDFLRTE